MATQTLKFVGIPKVDASEDGNMPYFLVDAKNFEEITGTAPDSMNEDVDTPGMYWAFTEDIFGHDDVAYEYEIKISRKGK